MDWAKFVLVFSAVVAGISLVTSGYLLVQSVLDRRALTVVGKNGSLKTLAWTMIMAETIRFIKLALLIGVVAMGFFFTPTEFVVVRRVLILLVISLISAGSIHGAISRRILTDAIASDATKEQNAAALAKLTALTADNVDVQLKQIHALVNSDMTAARQAELIAIEAHLLTLHRTEGVGPLSQAEHDIVNNLEARAAELRVIIADRIAQQEKEASS